MSEYEQRSSRAGGVRVHPAAEQRPVDPEEEDDEASLQRLLVTFASTVRRRLKLVVAIWLAFLIPVAAYAVTAVPEYTSAGAVQVSEGGGLGGVDPLMEIMGAGSQADVQTEVEIIRRREFLVDVLTGLGLQISDPNQPGLVTTDLDVALRGASPVNPAVRAVRDAAVVARVKPGHFNPVPIALSVPAKGQLSVTVGEDEPETWTFAVGEPFETDVFALEFHRAPLKVGGGSLELELLPEGALLEAYEGSIGVSGLGTIREPTNIVQISVSNHDRATAQAIVSTMMDRYLAKNLEWKSKSASQAAEFIEGQLVEVRKSLLQAEDKLKDFSAQENAVQLDTQAKVAIENAAELEAQRIALQLQEKTIGGVMARLKSGASPKASLTANFFDDPVLAGSVAALTQAETEYETMKATLTPEHPRVQNLGRALQLQKAEVSRLMRSAQKNLAHQKKQIGQELSAAMEAMSKYPDKQLDLARLMRDMEVSQRLYTLLLEKHEEAEIMKASTTTDKRVVDAASLPHRKTAPRRGRLLAFGAFGGLLMGVGFAFGAHVLQRKLETVEAVRESAPFPVYGTVPMVEGMGEDRLTIEKIWGRPHDPAPEAFRALGVSVSLIPGEGDGGRLIMVTSSQPGEGKSTIASNLALALGRNGKSVLLIDLDLRKPVQHRIWGVPRAPGYSDLVGQGGKASDLDRVAHDAQGCSVLPAGTRLPDTVAAIMAPSLRDMLREWEQRFDYVIIDSPPAFVAETSALAQYADLVLLVARPGEIERGNLRHAIEALDRVPVARGLVLNAVGRQHTEYYYGSGYYYYNRNYGDDADASTSGERVA